MSEAIIKKFREKLNKISFDIDDEDFNPNSDPVIALGDALKLELWLTEVIERVRREERQRIKGVIEEMKDNFEDKFGQGYNQALNDIKNKI